MDKLLKRMLLDQAPTLGGLAFVVCCLAGLAAAGFSLESSLLALVFLGPLFVLALYALVVLVAGILAAVNSLAGGVVRQARKRNHQSPSPEFLRTPIR
jgi:hypothetical protein